MSPPQHGDHFALRTKADPTSPSPAVGLLIAAVVVNATKDRNDQGSWAIPIGIQFAWAIILAGGLACLPESPRYLIAAGKDEAAQRALSRILQSPADSDIVAEQYAEIAAAVHHVRSLGATSYLDCFRSTNRNRLRTLTGISLQALQQLSGINFIFCASHSLSSPALARRNGIL